MVFYKYGKIVIGTGNVESLKNLFPENKLTFDSKYFPRITFFCSTQSSSGKFGEVIFKSTGEFSISGSGSSFTVIWITR